MDYNGNPNRSQSMYTIYRPGIAWPGQVNNPQTYHLQRNQGIARTQPNMAGYGLGTNTTNYAMTRNPAITPGAPVIPLPQILPGTPPVAPVVQRISPSYRYWNPWAGVRQYPENVGPVRLEDRYNRTPHPYLRKFGY